MKRNTSHTNRNRTHNVNPHHIAALTGETIRIGGEIISRPKVSPDLHSVAKATHVGCKLVPKSGAQRKIFTAAGKWFIVGRACTNPGLKSGEIMRMVNSAMQRAEAFHKESVSIEVMVDDCLPLALRSNTKDSSLDVSTLAECSANDIVDALLDEVSEEDLIHRMNAIFGEGTACDE